MAGEDIKLNRAKEYLLKHPGATNEEVRTAAMVSGRTVSTARAQLVEENLIPPAWGDHKKGGRKVNMAQALEDPDTDIKTTKDLNAELEKELAREAAANAAADAELGEDGEVDVQKLKRKLWQIVYRNRDDRIVVAAASAISRIQIEQSARALGPGKPMTEASALDRLKMIFEPVGPRLILKAFVECFGLAAILTVVNEWLRKEQDVGLQATKAVEPANAPSAPAAPTGPADNPGQAQDQAE